MSSFVRHVKRFVKRELTSSLLRDFDISYENLLDGIQYVAAWSLLLPGGISSDLQLDLMLSLAWRVNFALRASQDRFAYHFDFIGSCLILYIFLFDLNEVALVQQAVLDIRQLDSIPASADHVVVKKMNSDGSFLGAVFRLQRKERAESQRELFQLMMRKFGVAQIWSAPGQIRLVREYWRSDIARAPDIMHF